MGAIIKVKIREMELNVQSIKAEVESAKSEVELAQSQMDKTVIVAPNDGVMGTRYVEAGDFVTPLLDVSEFAQQPSDLVEVQFPRFSQLNLARCTLQKPNTQALF